MTMNAGSVAITVSDDGAFHTAGAGLALAIADALLATAAFARKVALAKPAPGQVQAYAPPAPWRDTLDAFVRGAAAAWARDIEMQANGIAVAVVAHLQANAVATLDASTSAGRLPSSFSAGAPIQPPAAPLALPIT